MQMRPAVILLADDSETDVLLAMEALRAANPTCVVHVVDDGVKALDYLRGDFSATGTKPDLVFLDLNMPRMDGRAVLQEMRADPALSVIPVVVMSTSTAIEDIRDSYRLHGNCYISKPMDVSRFMEVVQDAHHFWMGVATLPAAEP